MKWTRLIWKEWNQCEKPLTRSVVEEQEPSLVVLVWPPPSICESSFLFSSCVLKRAFWQILRSSFINALVVVKPSIFVCKLLTVALECIHMRLVREKIKLFAKKWEKITLSAYSALQYNSFGLKLRQCQSSSWRPPWRLDRLERLHQPLCCFSSIRKNQSRLVDFLNLLPNFFWWEEHVRNYIKIFFINIKVGSQGRVKKYKAVQFLWPL